MWLGRSLCFLAERLRDEGKVARVFAVDNWTGGSELKGMVTNLERDGPSVRDRFLANVRACGVEQYVVPVTGDSAESAKLFEDGKVFCVFIDASHEYGDVLRDIKAWLPKVAPGGWIGGHDVNRDGVRNAVKEVFGNDWEADNYCWFHRVRPKGNTNA